MGIKDLGDWAESEFASLCSEAGVTRNRSSQDRTGWDYLVEFPQRCVAGVPADLWPVGRTARVQVKSKARGKPTVTLKLSNALRFAKEPAACFVVLFQATNGGRPLRIYARHFWTEEIERTLRRAREAGDVDDAALARKTLTIAFDDEDDHSADLLDWMEATISAVGENYGETKAAFERTVGLGDGSIHGSIRFLEADLEALVDHQIGLRADAPVVEVVIRHSRFGIDGPTPLASGRPDFAHMRVHPKSCRVRIRGADGLTTWLDGELFSPAIPGLPKEFLKQRIVADFVELTVADGGEQRITIAHDADQRRSLPSLRALVRIWTQCALGALDIHVFHEDRVLLGLAATVQAGGDARWLQQMGEALDCLMQTIDGSQPQGLEVSFRELMMAWGGLSQFAALITGTNMTLTLNFLEPPALAGPVRGLLARDFVEVGGWTFMVVVERPVTATIEGRRMHLSCGPAIVREGFARQGPASAFLPELYDRYAMALQMGGADLLEVCGGDFGALLRLVAEGTEAP